MKNQIGQREMNPYSPILLTIDIEDWFQVENLRHVYPRAKWESCVQRVRLNTRILLDLFEHYAVSATFFVLGWLAERDPELVREIHTRGHEIASHGYNHDLCSMLSTAALREDLRRSKALLEDITGVEIVGYRAPSFSITDDVMDTLRQEGYKYDSSWNSTAVSKRYGRLRRIRKEPGAMVYLADCGLSEIPISNLRVGSRFVPWGGGGYFRFWPPALFRWGVTRILRQDGFYLFYLHPWELDSTQPRVREISPLARYRHYKNLPETFHRISTFLSTFQDSNWMGCREFLSGQGQNDLGVIVKAIEATNSHQTNRGR
jgi:polysaccharide deacetylase family protein (PEP-CTERM system associated)